MITIDRGPRSIVAVCVCGARDVFTIPTAVDTWVVAHLAVAHPDTSAARTRAITASRVRRHRG